MSTWKLPEKTQITVLLPELSKLILTLEKKISKVDELHEGNLETKMKTICV